jgi:hypothetical protein
VNSIDGRPRLLLVAALLLTTAIVAYQFHDAEANHQRLIAAESILRARDEQSRQSIAGLRARSEENLAISQFQAELLGRYERILEVMSRIEKSLETSAPIPGRLTRPKAGPPGGSLSEAVPGRDFFPLQ